ncbi:hypothetical protein A0H81_00919 [Grifola frondosa]|uniref:Uncharacterized protein n=1 Tax=Grifola frondosa TaxID=5627 RepID=A0A1C7MST4_GRIFR|nr:hypothetical protein A0H81_00919 [Grifola frondosa]
MKEDEGKPRQPNQSTPTLTSPNRKSSLYPLYVTPHLGLFRLHPPLSIISSERHSFNNPSQSYQASTYDVAPSYEAHHYLGGMTSDQLNYPSDLPSYNILPNQWNPTYDYLEPVAEYMATQRAPVHPHADFAYPGVPLHAPVPISGYSSLLPATPAVSTQHAPAIASSSTPTQSTVSSSPMSAHPAEASPITPESTEQPSPLEAYSNAPQILFPTPSELLTDLHSRGRGDCAPPIEQRGGSDGKVSRSSASGTRKVKEETPVSDKQPENQRKAYFRAVAESIGFRPTDPDTITSHDKKRSYLECLEEYVQWLHEQIRLVGYDPVPIERVSTYRGLNSRSVRTMLVHMQDDIRKLNMQKVQEEQNFLDLHNQVLAREGLEGQDLTQSSVASCAIPENPMVTFLPPTWQ